MSGPLNVYVDWSKDGDFADVDEDVTAFVRGPVSLAYGRDQATALSPVVAGRGGFDLDNRARTFSPKRLRPPVREIEAVAAGPRAAFGHRRDHDHGVHPVPWAH